MGFGGHALDMIKKMEYSRNLMKANKAKLKDSNAAHSVYSKNHKSLEIKKKDISEEELEQVKSDFRAKLKKQKRLELIISITIAAIVIPFFIYLIFGYMKF